MILYYGVVENRNDPMKAGRCQVRIAGLHTHEKGELPTDDLPWAYPMQPITSAGMSGIGHSPVGPVEGTWVVIMFTDDDQQYPIMMGTLGGVPQAPSAVDSDTPNITMKDINGNEPAEPSETVSSPQSNEPVKTTELTPQEQAQNVLQPGTNPAPTTGETQTVTTDIPTTPPPEFKTLIPQRTAAIKALLAACDKFGIKSREVKCSILAMAGGESGYIPSDEGYSYSESALKSVFYTTFTKKHPDKAAQYARAPSKGMSREEFFNFVYAPENNGSGLGNTQPGDGGKYFGRGLTGITGRYAFGYYGNKIGVDLLANPGLLTTDLNISAQASAMMIWDNTKKKFKNVSETAHPDYFYAAKRAQGKDANEEGSARRLRYYEYFYGNKVSSTFTTDKSAAPLPPTDSTPSPSAETTSTGGSTAAPAPNASGAAGFKDPNNKYPLSTHTKEPDTNRLARGQSKGTVVNNKELNRKTGIPTANNDLTFDEPKSSFAAKYPYNHVTETESGHIREMDDTPGHERIHEYHRTGTFYEIDPNGTKVTHIVGDDYHIMDRNGTIYIAGECNITVGGQANILCQNNAEVEIVGDANINVKNNANIGIAKDANVVVGQNMKFQVNQTLDIKANAINIESATTFNIKALTLNNAAPTININGTTINETAVTFNVNASTYRETVGTSHYRWNGTKYMFTGADTHERHNSGTDFSNSSDPARSGSDGASNAATASIASTAASAITGLTAPEIGLISTNVFEPLEAPPSEGEEAFLIETEEEWNSPAGKALQAENEKQYGTETPPTQEEGEKATGGAQNNTVASCQVIYGMQDFTNDFKLSQNFTLGMLIDGGVNGHNKLRDQNGLTKQQIVCNLSQLCQNIYEPLLAVLPGGIGGYGKQWKINSGYRISSNVPAGGVAKSDHMLGRATDMTLLPYGPNKAKLNFDFANQIEKLIPYDQIIMEYMPGGSNWVHIGYRGLKEGDTAGGGTNRKMAFTMSNGKTIKRDGFLLQ